MGGDHRCRSGSGGHIYNTQIAASSINLQAQNIKQAGVARMLFDA
jgi:hypothetical protein